MNKVYDKYNEIVEFVKCKNHYEMLDKSRKNDLMSMANFIAIKLAWIIGSNDEYLSSLRIQNVEGLFIENKLYKDLLFLTLTTSESSNDKELSKVYTIIFNDKNVYYTQRRLFVGINPINNKDCLYVMSKDPEKRSSINIVKYFGEITTTKFKRTKFVNLLLRGEL